MTTEKSYNKELGDCTYNELNRNGNTVLWERVSKSNNIDYVVGIKWSTKSTPTFVNFDITRSRDIAMRFLTKEDSSSFFFHRVG